MKISLGIIALLTELAFMTNLNAAPSAPLILWYKQPATK